MPEEMHECAVCTHPVHDDEAHFPTTDQVLRDNWNGDESFHPECCPYCANSVQCLVVFVCEVCAERGTPRYANGLMCRSCGADNA